MQYTSFSTASIMNTIN